jgi:hypothetical protein
MVTSLKIKSQVSKLILRPSRSQSLRSLTHPLGCETETETRSGILRHARKTRKVSNQTETSLSQIDQGNFGARTAKIEKDGLRP